MSGRLLLTFLLIGLVLFSGTFCDEKSHGSVLATAAVDQRQAMLDATVRITLVAPKLNESGEALCVMQDGCCHPQLVLDDGLGTVVSDGQRTLIVTHDHWSLLTPALRQVRIADHEKQLLALLSGFAFRNLIRYRDGGTLIFLAPEGVQATEVPTRELDAEQDVTMMAYLQQDGNLEFRPVAVVERSETEAVIVLPNSEAIVRGNSGGGLWNNGSLIGNLWRVEYCYRQQGTTAGDIEQEQIASRTVVALLPAA